MRASHLHSNLEALSILEPADEAAIRARAADAIAEIEASVRTAWLPLPLDVALTAAVEAVVGPDGLRAWGREAILESASGPLLGPVRSALVSLGLNPLRTLKRAPSAWGLIYRHCGALRFEARGEREAALLLDDAPPAMRDPTYLRGIEGAFEAAIAIGGGEEARARFEGLGEPLELVCTWR